MLCCVVNIYFYLRLYWRRTHGKNHVDRPKLRLTPSDFYIFNPTYRIIHTPPFGRSIVGHGLEQENGSKIKMGDEGYEQMSVFKLNHCACFPVFLGQDIHIAPTFKCA